MNPDCTLFVNSTDSFSDCWPPFFQLLADYWPACPFEILLNTETANFSHPSLPVRATKIGTQYAGSPAQWTAALRAGLEQVPTPFVLYVQEDYFLNAPVREEDILEFLFIMSTEQLSHIRLVTSPCGAPYRPHPKYQKLWEIPQRANYRICLQAGLWRKSNLLRYLKDGETPWQLEIFGTERSHHIPDSLFTVNADLFDRVGKMVFPYTLTGIVKGKWYRPAVEPLFSQHQIQIDFSKRGFWEPPSPLANWLLKQRHEAGRWLRRFTINHKR
jgi:hypothetical protein